MCFLYLIEQHDTIRLTAYGFSQLSALIVTHISRRGTDESSGTELLLVLGHIDTRHHVLVVEQIVRQGFRQLRFTDTRRTEEDE